MDVNVIAVDGGTVRHLTDLLGRFNGDHQGRTLPINLRSTGRATPLDPWRHTTRPVCLARRRLGPDRKAHSGRLQRFGQDVDVSATVYLAARPGRSPEKSPSRRRRE